MIQILILLLCLVPSTLFGATRIGTLYCEDSLDGGLTVYQPESITYVTGHTGKACRMSHNSDDGVATDTEVYWIFPDSGEVNILFWIKYESGYSGDCGTIWNVKWLWTGQTGEDNHTEMIWQYYTAGNMIFSFYMTSPTEPVMQEVSGVNFPYTIGDWMQVNIYMKQSTGTGGTNADGIYRLTINDTIVRNSTTMVTKTLVGQTIRSPSLKGTCDANPGWWQLDDYEVWDGIATSSPTISGCTLSGVSR